MLPQLLDFDNIDVWAINLDKILYPLITDSTIKKIRESKFKYIEDSQDLLFKLTNRDQIINAVIEWICSNKIVGYHGTRITKVEIDSIRKNGLLSLNAIDRVSRLTRVLSSHPEWDDIKNKLNDTIQSHGKGNYSGRREGQAHLTLSKSSLTNWFNHYISYGSEFDQRVVVELLGEEGKDLLAKDGISKVIKFSIPGNLALKAAHPIGSLEQKIQNGEVPNLVNQFIKAWSCRIVNSNFQSSDLCIDCGMVFLDTIPPEWIVEIKTITLPST